MTAPPSGPGVRVNRRGQLSHGASKLQEKSEVTFSKKNPRVRKATAFLGGKNAGEIMGCCLKVRECRNYRGQNRQRGNKTHELLEGSQSNSYQTAEEGKRFLSFLQNMSNHSSFCGSRLALKWIVSSPSAEFSFRSQNPISGLI